MDMGRLEVVLCTASSPVKPPAASRPHPAAIVDTCTFPPGAPTCPCRFITCVHLPLTQPRTLWECTRAMHTPSTHFPHTEHIATLYECTNKPYTFHTKTTLEEDKGNHRLTMS